VWCSIVDLSCAIALTHLRLLGIDHPDTFSLHLPSSLQSFSFSGHGSFLQRKSKLFCKVSIVWLTCMFAQLLLTKKLFKSFCDIPVLPNSLRELTLVCPPNTALFWDSDWHCLSACSQLAHIYLHGGCQPSEHLQAWVKKLQGLKIVYVCT